jgi:hypothetical protein|tara:strand:- start:398 stop:925 length:528 start_codon:yes stop_codon:yes gene_type:complete
MKKNKYKGELHYNFGSIYKTKHDKNGIKHTVALIDLMQDEKDQFFQNFVIVAPISDNIDFAADDDLIIQGIENDGLLPYDITIHAGMLTTIAKNDLTDYYCHLPEKYEKMLKDLLLLLKGDYSVDINKLKIGKPIHEPDDYRIEYRRSVVKDLQYFSIPAFLSISNYINAATYGE